MVLALAFIALGGLAGDEAFDEGVLLYKGLEYEQAAARFAEITSRPDLAPPEKAEALVWLGLCLAGTGDLDAARRTLKNAVLTDQAVRLPTATAISPRVQALFDDVLAETHAAPPRPPPPPPPSPPPPPTAPVPVLPTALIAGGAVAAAGGVVLALLAVGHLQQAEDPDAFQVDAKAALDAANVEGVSAGVLLTGGAGAVAAGIVLFTVAD
ncbi:MAG: hypothetical protein A2138_25470 [Deltaproteobacteria bacterium RBG_16_71_12]|nr:MAG: hypothetical protein A2138_25470 [Deltaproteobacteria bacterium RBG_16_71_12]